MAVSKTKKATLNSIVGVLSQLFQILLSFVTRTIFIKLLGPEFLGVNGIYSNILSILSIAELGVGNILIFYLYRPIVNKNEEKIKEILNFSRKIYCMISLVIFIIGILLIPFLPSIVKSTLQTKDLVIYYIIYLMNTIASYLYVYKTNLLYADQLTYKISLMSNVVIFFQYSMQIIVLTLYKNYSLYLLVMLFCTFINNYLCSKIADKNYAYLLDDRNDKLPSSEKKIIIQDVKSMFLYKLGVVIMNYTDNILISMVVGTVFVGYYSNYLLIMTMLNTFISTIIRGITGSIGNLIAEGNKSNITRNYYMFLYMFEGIGSVVTVCLLFLFNDFISIWIGKEFLLSSDVVIVIVITFYVNCTSNQNWIFREAAGYYKNVKLVMIIAALINLVLSIILGWIWGLSGILIATLIARLCTLWWYDPVVLSKNLLTKNCGYYFLKVLLYQVILLIIVFVNLIFKGVIVNNILTFFVKGITIFTVSLILFVVLNIKNTDQKFMFDKIMVLLKSLK